MECKQQHTIEGGDSSIASPSTDSDYSFLEEIRQQNEVERNTDYSVTPEEAKRLQEKYPMGQPMDETWAKIKPEEFFDGN